MFVLFHVIAAFGLGFLDGLLGLSDEPGGGPLYVLYTLASFLPVLAVSVRRMHDTDRSGWWCLVPFVNFVFYVTEGTRGPNRFGPDPKAEKQTSTGDCKMNEVVNPGDRVRCPYCGDSFGLDESDGLGKSGGSPLIKVPCCSCGRMFEVKILGSVKERSKEPLSLHDAVNLLARIYEEYPEGLYPGAPDRDRVREIGQALYDAGGMDYMLFVHQEFTRRNPRHARNLDLVWNGIGKWLG